MVNPKALDTKPTQHLVGVCTISGASGCGEVTERKFTVTPHMTQGTGFQSTGLTGSPHRRTSGTNTQVRRYCLNLPS